MSSVSPRRSRLRTLLLWAAPLTWLGCGGDGGGTDVVLPALSVTTSTQGVELDPDGYSLLIDATESQPVGVSATLVVERLSDGDHTLELAGLAANCSAQGANPRTISVHSGSTASTAFQVVCAATVGSIEVSTSTSGIGSDADGYTIVLDGAERGAIAGSATMDIGNLAAGSHSVGLTGLAGNCQVAGDNPRTISVSPSQTTQVPFSISCVVPGPTTGSLQISTSTTGENQDPDGYTVTVDGGASQPIGLSSTLTLTNISSGVRRVQLNSVAPNCTVSGANPRNATVSAGETALVSFTISCSAPGPTLGALEITTSTSGENQDPDGYTLAVDGGAIQPIGLSSTLTLTDVASGVHRVELGGLASNCTVSGSNPRNATVNAGETARVAFTIACTAGAPETGAIRATVATSGGSPDPDGYTLALDGGSPVSLSVNGNHTFPALPVGSHSVQLGGLAGNCSVSGANPRSVSVSAGATATVSFEVSCVAAGPSINLRVERMYLTQSTQRLTGDVPLVEGRDGFVRVFVTANGSNNARPTVRVRLYRNGTLAQTYALPARGSSTPTTVQQDGLDNSWNVEVPGNLIAAGTSLLADVDPANEIPETSEGDNSFPASGTPVSLTVQSVAPATIRLVPILQTATGLEGSVGNPAQLTSLVRRMYPLSSGSTEVRNVFTATGPLQPGDANGQWGQILTDLEALRVTDNATDRTYYGLVRLDYPSGIVGNGFIGGGAASAIGYDDPGDASRVMAHELGHTWGQFHTPCGSPSGVDGGYPYPGGNIGVFGYDPGSGTIKAPSLPDIMGYCGSPWISDYIYQRVLSYRRSNPLTVPAGSAQPSLLVWGRIENGRPVLEPALQIVARPHLPKMRGPYSLEGTAGDGSRLFSFSFDAPQSADDRQGNRHFAFAIPLDAIGFDRLQNLRLSSSGAVAATVSRPLAQTRKVGPGDIAVLPDADGVRLRWNAAAHPVILVRDPDTGEVLSFARGGDAHVRTGKRTVDLNVSDGVRSQRLRRAISR